MNIRYRVDLNEAEHTEPAALLNGGTHAVRKIKRAQILVAADAGASDEAIARVSRLASRRSIAPSGALLRATLRRH